MSPPPIEAREQPAIHPQSASNRRRDIRSVAAPLEDRVAV